VSSDDAFESFRRVVLDEPELQARLRAYQDWSAFVDAAVDAAAERGIALTEEDVLAARETARRSWLERWI